MSTRFPLVMLVDDNELDNFINKKLVEADSFADATTIHTSAQSALDYLKNNAADNAQVPDLIFLDITLPGSDGLAILRTLHEKFEKLRVVMLAANTDIPKANMALNCGASDYIAKPVDLPTIKRTLQIHLGTSH